MSLGYVMLGEVYNSLCYLVTYFLFNLFIPHIYLFNVYVINEDTQNLFMYLINLLIYSFY